MSKCCRYWLQLELDDLNRSCKLRIGTSREDVKLLVIRATDVPVFVDHGVADLGLVGKDTFA